MIPPLILWFVTFASLMLTLVLLSWVYDVFGGDLGLTSWRRESVIALIVSLLQAILFWFTFSVVGVGTGKLFPVAGIVLMLFYKVTHFSSDLLEGTSDMDNGQIFAIAAVQFAILFGLQMWLTIARDAH